MNWEKELQKILSEDYFERGKTKVISNKLINKNCGVNLFLITSPFQLISAIEAVNYFKLENNILYLLDFNKKKLELELLLQLSSKFPSTKFVTFKKTNFLSFFKLIRELQSYKYDYIFYGENHSLIRRALNNISYDFLYFIGDIKASNKLRKNVKQNFQKTKYNQFFKYNTKDKIKFFIYNLFGFRFQELQKDIHFFIDCIGFDSNIKHLTYPKYIYIWEHHKDLVLLYPELLIPFQMLKHPTLMKKKHIGSIEKYSFYSRAGDTFIYPTALTFNDGYYEEVQSLFHKVDLDYSQEKAKLSLEDKSNKLKQALLLMDGKGYEKYINSIINDVIEYISADNNGISADEFLKTLILVRENIKNIYKISSHFIHKKSLFIKCENFYILFDLLMNRYKDYLISIDDDKVHNKMLIQLTWIFSHYSWRATYFGEKEKINQYLNKYHFLFKDHLLKILKSTSIFTYSGLNNSYNRLLLKTIEEFKTLEKYKKDCNNLHDYLVLLNFFSGDINPLCDYFFRNQDILCPTIEEKQNILSICLESPKYYQQAYTVLWEMLMDPTLPVKIQKRCSFRIIQANCKQGNIELAKILLLRHYSTFECKTINEAKSLLSLFKDTGLSYSHQHILQEVFYTHVFIPMKEKPTLTNIIEFLLFQDYFSEIDLLKDLDLIYQTKLRPQINQMLKQNSFEKIALIQPSRSPMERSVPLHIYKQLLDKNILVLNLELDPIGFFNDYPYDNKPILTPLGKSIINSDVHWNEKHNQWEEDLFNQKVSCNDINVYQGVFERFFRGQRVFSVNFDSHILKKPLHNLTVQIDRVIRAIDIIDEKLAYPLLYISTAVPHYPPWSGVRDYFYKKNNAKKYGFVHVTSIYENYLSKMSNTSLTTLTALNLTEYRKSRAAFLGSSELFKKYFEEQRIIHKFPIVLKEKITQNTQTETSHLDLNKKYVKAVKKAKDKKQIVVCLLGKIPYDLSVPYMNGTFKNMKEWAQQTEQFISKREDIFALIKPHPHEKNISISQYANESFLDFFEGTSKNIYMLEHTEASLEDLYGLVDVFLLWNGTSVIELAQNRQNIIVCDDWAVKDYPINLYQPKTPDEYYQAILKIKEIESQSDIITDRQIKAYFFIKYMKSKAFYVNNIGIHRSNTNTNFHKVLMNLDEIFNEFEKPTQDWDKILKLINPDRYN